MFSSRKKGRRKSLRNQFFIRIIPGFFLSIYFDFYKKLKIVLSRKKSTFLDFEQKKSFENDFYRLFLSKSGVKTSLRNDYSSNVDYFYLIRINLLLIRINLWFFNVYLYHTLLGYYSTYRISNLLRLLKIFY